MEEINKESSSGDTPRTKLSSKREEKGEIFIREIQGYWKRAVEVRNLGGLFQHVGTKNDVIRIEEIKRDVDSDVDDSNVFVRYLRWSFGLTPLQQDLTFGYEMKVKMNQSSHLSLDWSVENSRCEGKYDFATQTMVLEFNTKRALEIITYSFVDDNLMSAVIVEICKSDKEKKRNIQMGNLYRIQKLQV